MLIDLLIILQTYILLQFFLYYIYDIDINHQDFSNPDLFTYIQHITYLKILLFLTVFIVYICQKNTFQTKIKIFTIMSITYILILNNNHII